MRKRGTLNKEQMRSPSESLNRFWLIDDNSKVGPYSYLACGIICVAVDDYRMAMKNDDMALKRELEVFFNSSWFELLTDINPLYLIQKLRQEHEERLCAC